LKDMLIDEFQYTVSDLLVRNKSIIDQITKFQDTNARINRTIVKAATQCGCIKINAKKQNHKTDGDIEELKKLMKSHLEGKLCDNCRDLLEKEIGRNLFYLTSIVNTLDINLYDVIIKELERLKILGNYNLR